MLSNQTDNWDKLKIWNVWEWCWNESVLVSWETTNETNLQSIVLSSTCWIARSAKLPQGLQNCLPRRLQNIYGILKSYFNESLFSLYVCHKKGGLSNNEIRCVLDHPWLTIRWMPGNFYFKWKEPNFLIKTAKVIIIKKRKTLTETNMSCKYWKDFWSGRVLLKRVEDVITRR